MARKPKPKTDKHAAAGVDPMEALRGRQIAIRQAVNVISKEDLQIEALKVTMKTHKKTQKEVRDRLKREFGPGVLTILDEAMADANKGRIDLAAKEILRVEVRSAIGVPVSGEKEALDAAPDTAPDWEAAGYTAGLMAKDPEPPVPGEDAQAWMKGWSRAQDELGQKLVEKMSAANGAKKPKAQEPSKPPANPPEEKQAFQAPVAHLWGTVSADGTICILNEKAFESNIAALEDFSLAALVNEDARAAWAKAERVLINRDGQRRILKEPGYEDTGEEGVDPSAPVEGEETLDGAVPAEDLVQQDEEAAALA